MKGDSIIRRVAPVFIERLHYDEIFVFASNLSGKHINGSAKVAFEKFGAKWGRHFGLSGQSFAIPVRGNKFGKLPLATIECYVEGLFIEARKRSDLVFIVTPIAIGNNMYEYEDIAPLFEDALEMKNIFLPEKFYNILIKRK